jgi:hypothetical protein
MSTRPTSLLPAALVLSVILGCADAATSPEADLSTRTPGASAAHGAGNPNAAGLLKAVHAATARFHSTVQATRSGYEVASGCVAHPTLGAMGYHWSNGALVDPVFEPLRPEAVLYEPQANGSLKLVAVEYIVIDIGQPAPTFDGRAFDEGGTPVPVPHWSLHVWVHRDNPNGVFTPFNPAVSCSP